MESRAQLLSRAHSGDRDAVQQMIEENAGLIWSVARRYFGRGVDADDLYQLGCLGFLKAIEGFDERFGTQFSTYAVPKISGEIRRFLRDDGAIKVSRSRSMQHAAVWSRRSAGSRLSPKSPRNAASAWRRSPRRRPRQLRRRAYSARAETKALRLNMSSATMGRRIACWRASRFAPLLSVCRKRSSR